MFLAALLIGLREGLEAALIVSILIAYARKLGRDDLRRRIWFGVVSAVILSAVLGAVFTFGRSRLSFKAQEIIGGSMSLLAVVMITAMVVWMVTSGPKLKKSLESGVDAAVTAGSGTALTVLAFVSVAREGIETTLILWGWTDTVTALAGAFLGIGLAVLMGWGLFKGVLKIDLGRFFTWSGAFLLIVAGGILAYGIHDLQEAAVLPGPFSGAPISPTHPRTGEVLTGFADYPFWGAAFPFGWAFDFSDSFAPDSFIAALLKGTVGFVPQMSWLEVTAWFIYMVLVIPPFVRRTLGTRRAKKKRIEDAKTANPKTNTQDERHLVSSSEQGES
ncbi:MULTISPECIES: iron uptake transporter permease EfeU [unclassified Brevibacterium]|uniref:iron uptake transporter permease EfeU n=1 Tax=unclassified Brevibacterium TaxID=2614124 RepID=UPI0008A59148|nr:MULTISPECIES: iron uptake transporter permease EfeU [unclassified Brevibacterium]OFL67575.1 high-affinity Fe2+/Pb2+ permease [Brevibacterium sp. HMSC063G07]OFS27867.1 high-affinity Fe2+/Pb2+ permease [Brevibacterium sp. HMSC07C04]